MRRTYAQIKPRKTNFVTVSNTAWLYPEADIKSTLESTTFNYIRNGDSIICPTLEDLIGVYYDIYLTTAVSQPIGSNRGYSIGAGTLLEDMGKEIRFSLTGGKVVIVWRLVKLLTPQGAAVVIPVRGNSTNDIIGYVTTFTSLGNGASYAAGLDDVMVVRVG